MSLPFLQSFGLSDTEASLYELLLKLGESPAWQIVKESKLKRPTVYKALGNLEKKGLVAAKDKGKIIHFTPAPPTELLTMAEEKYTSLERAKNDLQSVLPALLSSYTMAVEKPVVRTFEGIDGLKQIYEDTLKEGKEIYAVLETAEVEPSLFKWLTTTYARKRVAAKIHAKVIVASGTWSGEYRKRDVDEYRTTVLVPKEKFPFEHEVDIYGDKVAFIHFRKDEPLIGIVIHHPHIAKTMKAWFDLAWEGATKK